MLINRCDYVLLDGVWAERVEKMKKRIAKAGSTMPLAKASRSGQGVQAFLNNLETFDKRAEVNPLCHDDL